MTLKAVIYDLGGVLSRADQPRVIPAWEEKLGLPAGTLNETVWGNEVSLAAFRGEATPQQVWDHVRQHLQLDAGTCFALQQDIFADSVWDQEMLCHLQALRGQVKLGVISDAWINARENTKEVIHEGLFDVLVFSAEEGCMKPDPRIYHRALSLLQVEPHEAVFIDNQPENVEGATLLGMQGILFESPAQTLQALEALLRK